MAREAGLEELLKTSFQSLNNNNYTAIPCIVVGVNLATSTVDIQPSINQKLKDGTVAERPPVLGVPISFPVSKTAGFTFPIEVGDTGLAVFSMRDMTAWKAGNGRPATPLTNGKMDKSDAIFIPGIQPPNVAVNNPTKRVWQHDVNDAVLVNNIGETEVEIRLKASGDVVVNTSQNVEINCKNAIVNASTSVSMTSPDIFVYGNITHAGNYTITGTATFNGIVFDSHVHGSSPGPSNP